jgi:predicted alpha/beta-fold hydrolase
LTRRIAVPTLVIYGRHDKLVNSKMAHGVHDAFPSAQVVMLSDCGHVAQMEHPEEVAALWLNIIGRPARSGS